ncbi:MAG: hypothetical protein ACI8RD_014348 [Bacillariaceae sp.]|jgi:hypothetical protein
MTSSYPMLIQQRLLRRCLGYKTETETYFAVRKIRSPAWGESKHSFSTY